MAICPNNLDTTFQQTEGCVIPQNDTRTVVEFVDDIDNVPTFFTEDQTDPFGLIYTHYRIDVRYERFENVLQMPVAEESAFDTFGLRVDSEFVQVAAPHGRKVVSWSAERVGGWPQAPGKNPDSTNEVFITEHVTPATPTAMPGGTQLVFRVSGTYWFGLRQCRGPGDALPTGFPQYQEIDTNDATMQSSDWNVDVLADDPDS